MNLGPLEVVLVGAMVCLLVAPIWAFVDALQASKAQWAAIGESRAMWLVLIGAGTILGGFFGVILAVVYLLTTRRKLAAAR